MHTTSSSKLENALTRINQIASQKSASITQEHKATYSQYFTEGNVARQMASMLEIEGGARIGDHGAGTGVLGATVLAHAITENSSNQPYTLRSYEIDELLHDAFNKCLDEVMNLASEFRMPKPIISLSGDFTLLAEHLCRDSTPSLDAVILNPPYRKLHQKSELALLLRKHIVPTPNLYALFIVLSVQMLRPGGQLVAIIPRSFTSGTHFRAFRQWLRRKGSIDWFVRYKRRSNVFRGDNVLQENVIIRFTKGAQQSHRVRISLCDSPERPPVFESLVPAYDIFPNHTDIIFVPANFDELSSLHAMQRQPYTLADLGLKVSTGRLEDFRMRQYLSKSAPSSPWAPVIYAQHWKNDSKGLSWTPVTTNNKPACLSLNETTMKKVVPRGNYVLIKRISANDDRVGRCHPCVLTTDSDIPGDFWAIDNHIQIISAKANTLNAEKSRALTQYLTSKTVEHVLRSVSGTTQLNKNDLLQLRFPNLVL